MIVFSTFSVVSTESNFVFYVRKGLLFFSMLLAKNFGLAILRHVVIL